MRWVITTDHLNKGKDDPLNRVGKGNHPFMEGGLLPFFFRLYDDDGELYYSGKCDNPEEFPEAHAFAPLDYGMADAGCTRMDYRGPGGPKGWQTL